MKKDAAAATSQRLFTGSPRWPAITPRQMAASTEMAAKSNTDRWRRIESRVERPLRSNWRADRPARSRWRGPRSPYSRPTCGYRPGESRSLGRDEAKGSGSQRTDLNLRVAFRLPVLPVARENRNEDRVV